MGKKKLQGADGMNFQLQLTIKGLESINLPEENLTNESGNDIMKISCWGGKLSAYVNLPNAIRPNNVQPFQLSDCIKIELVRNQVIEHMRSYLQTTKISVMGNLLDVSVYEYVDKEEHDAKLLFSGMLLKEYHVNKDTGEIEEIQ